MVFSSLTFLYLFLPINLFLYFLVKNRTYKNFVLIISSLLFYAWGEPVWVSLLIFSSVIDYIHGRIVEAYRGRWQSKAALASSIVVNLLLLGTFKYSAFFAQNINSLFSIKIPYSEFSLPIGISFYTFQTISYVVDVYRGEVSAQKSFWKFLMFVSLFHQLVAGPIVRYKDIAYEIENREFNLGRFSEGISRFVVGLGKKVIIANIAGEIATIFLSEKASEMTVLGSWYGMILFSIQIYFDFSGYSDMAIGLGRMFGFTYKENFNYPYISKSATEFWRRWHISLGSFFRDYIYIPLGGNRKRHILNLLIVWFLTGLWHGASWNFVVWGMFYGFLIIVEKILMSKVKIKVPAIISHCYLLVITIIGWTFFYFEDLKQATNFLGTLFGFNNRPLVNLNLSIYFMNNIIFFIIAIIACTPLIKWVKNRIDERFIIYNQRHIHVYKAINIYKYIVVPILNFVLLIICTVLLVGETYNPFLYFRF